MAIDMAAKVIYGNPWQPRGTPGTEWQSIAITLYATLALMTDLRIAIEMRPVDVAHVVVDEPYTVRRVHEDRLDEGLVGQEATLKDAHPARRAHITHQVCSKRPVKDDPLRAGVQRGAVRGEQRGLRRVRRRVLLSTSEHLRRVLRRNRIASARHGARTAATAFGSLGTVTIFAALTIFHKT